MLATKPFPRTGLQITIEKKNQLTIFRAVKKKANERRTIPRIAQNARETFGVTVRDPAAASANMPLLFLGLRNLLGAGGAVLFQLCGVRL